MSHLKISANRLEGFFGRPDDPWESECVQLSPGPLGFRSELVFLPGVTVGWHSVAQPLRLRDRFGGSGIAIAVVLKGSAITNLEGAALGPGQGVLWRHGDEFEYVTPRKVRSLVVEVDGWLTSLLGWRFARAGMASVPTAAAAALTAACRKVTENDRARLASDQVETRGRGGPKPAALANRVTDALAPALAPWIDPAIPPCPVAGVEARTRRARYEIVRQACRVAAREGLESPIVVPDLARQVGVSERSLQRAFQTWVGMGPRAYLRLCQLHQFRDRLLASADSPGAVSRAAIDSGFDHLGRLAGTYRKHFGESPRQTLKRKPGKG